MSNSFCNVLCRLAENGFTDEALIAATVTNATYWDRDLWGYVAGVRSRGRCYSFATVPRGRTRLMEAAHSGRADRLKWLLSLDGGSNVGTIDFYGYNALFHGFESNHFDCAERLVSAGACMSDMVSSIKPYDAIFKKHSVFAACATNILVRSAKMVDSVAARQMMFLEAFQRGQVDCIRIMLASGLQFILSPISGTIIEAMSAEDKRRVGSLSTWHDIIAHKVKYLRHKVSCDDRKVAFAKDSLSRCYAAMLVAIFKAGAEMRPNDYDPIRYAFLISDVDAVRFLIDNDKASRNFALGAEHRSVVLKAVYNGFDRQKSITIASMLLDAGAPARVPAVSIDKQPLYLAVSAMSPQCVKVLIAREALERKNWFPYFDSFMASRINIEERVALGNDVALVLRQFIETTNFVDNDYLLHIDSPLHYLCRHGFASGVRLLLDHGACDDRALAASSYLYESAWQ